MRKPYVKTKGNSEKYKKLKWKKKRKKKGGVSVNYFANLGPEFHFSKIGCSECNFPKRSGC